MDDFRLLSRDAYAQKDWPAAADFARRAIEGGVPIGDLSHMLMILCVSLTACGKRPRAQKRFAATIDYTAQRGLNEADYAAPGNRLDFMLLAAIAAGDERAADTLYRRRHPLSGDFERIAISAVGRLDALPLPDVNILSTLPPTPIFIDMQAQTSSLWDYTTDPITIAAVPNGSFVMGWDYVVTQNRIVIADSGYNDLHYLPSTYPPCYLEDLNVVAHPWADAVTHIDADVLFLSTPADFHYGHWLVDFLPRLQALELLDRPDLKIVVATELPRKHRDLMRLFGITDDRVINCDLGKRYQFRNVIVAQIGSYVRPNPSAIGFLRKHLGTRAAQSPKPHRRFFFERGAGTRLPANRDEVNATLRAFGFEHIDLSKLTLAEEHDLLRNAKIIVAAHGTELLAVYGVPAKAEVIELIWDIAQDPAIGPICHFLGTRHQFLVCLEAPQAVKQHYRKDRDMIVDCAELRRRIEAAIARADS